MCEKISTRENVCKLNKIYENLPLKIVVYMHKDLAQKRYV